MEHALVPVNSQLEIQCSVTDGVLLSWKAIYESKNSTSLKDNGTEPQNIRIINIDRTLSTIVFNATDNNEVIAVNCTGILHSDLKVMRKTLNLTVFGKLAI